MVVLRSPRRMGGDIVEQGDHDALLEAGGAYDASTGRSSPAASIRVRVGPCWTDPSPCPGRWLR